MSGDDVVQQATRVIAAQWTGGPPTPRQCARALYDAGLLAEPDEGHDPQSLLDPGGETGSYDRNYGLRERTERRMAERGIPKGFDREPGRCGYLEGCEGRKTDEGIDHSTETWRLRGEFIDALARHRDSPRTTHGVDAFKAARALCGHLDAEEGKS